MKSLFWASEIDALALDRCVEQRPGYLLVRSPRNPGFYWGNLLMFDDAPRSGDGERWERLFAAEFADHPAVRHRTFAWQRTDGRLGAAHEEFAPRGYQLARTVGLCATPAQLAGHPRANRSVLVRALEPSPAGADAPLWEQVLALQLAGADGHIPSALLAAHRRARHEELCELFRARGGGWYVALDPSRERVLAGCAVVVNGQRASIHDVDTAAAHRRKGICSRLLVDAVRDVSQRASLRRVVIGADPDYHALPLYESLGFRAREHVVGVCLEPRA